MEEVAWIFNGDYEDRLFSERFYNFQSNKVTQEFEYFIHLLNPDLFVFTSKQYSSEYQDFIHLFTGKKFKTCHKAKIVRPWCNDYENFRLKQKLQSKIELAKFLDLNVEYVKDQDNLEPGYLYKYAKSLSGGGHYFYPQNEKRLIKLIAQNEVLIKERIYKRYLDFSTLVENGEVLGSYQNIIDDYFQYKGTLIEDNFALDEEHRELYEMTLTNILSYADSYTGIMSIDSFCYLENAKKYLYPACELNIRKTMGYVAYQLKRLYFSDSKVLKMRLFRNKLNDFSYSKLPKNTFLISPIGNRFNVFLICANDKDGVSQLESELTSTFF